MTAQWLLTETLAMLLPSGGHRPRAADPRRARALDVRGGLLGQAGPVAQAGRGMSHTIGRCASTRFSPLRTDPLGPVGSPFSFEFFPPKTEVGEQNLREALAELRQMEPSFVSVTYGAGGTTRGKTIEIVKRIKDEYGLEAMAHFTCVGATVAELRTTLDEMQRRGSKTCWLCAATRPPGRRIGARPRGASSTHANWSS